MSQESGSIFLVGTGRLASHLGPVLKRAGLLSGVSSRNSQNAEKFAAQLNVPVFHVSDLKPQDVVICAVSDDSLQEVLNAYSQHCFAVSTSGNFDISALKSANTGVFYPLQTFSKDSGIDFAQVPVIIEAENDILRNRLLETGRKTGGRTEIMNHASRQKLHVCAVFVNNFVTYLSAQGKSFAEANNVDFSLLHPLIRQTFGNLVSADDLFAYVTGPARRKDLTTIHQHESLQSGEMLELYEFITHSILKHYDQL